MLFMVKVCLKIAYNAKKHENVWVIECKAWQVQGDIKCKIWSFLPTNALNIRESEE